MTGRSVNLYLIIHRLSWQSLPVGQEKDRQDQHSAVPMESFCVSADICGGEREGCFHNRLW